MRLVVTPAGVFGSAWVLQTVFLAWEVVLTGVAPRLLTFFVCAVGVCLTALGLLIGYGIKLPKHNEVVIAPARAKFALGSLLLVGALGAMLTARQWLALGMDLVGGVTLYEMNVAYSQSREVFGGIPGRLYATLVVGLILTAYCVRHDLLSKKSASALALLVLVLMISPRRAAMITAALGFIWMLSLGVRLSVLRLGYALVLAGLFVSVFSFTQIELGKSSDASLESVFEVLRIYVGSSMYVMDALLETSHFERTAIVSNVPIRAVNAVFGTDVPVDLSVPFISYPVVSNTVPLYYYLYKSGGILGVGGVSFALGLLSTVSYRYSRQTCSLFWSSVAALMTVGLALSIRENFFFTYDFAWWCVCAGFCSWLTRPWVRS